MPSRSAEALLFNPNPEAYLPHRRPFLLLDRIVALQPGETATAAISVTGGTRHFPDVLLIEAMAQLGGIAAGHEEGEGGFLAAIDRATFIGSASAGDLLEVTVRVIKSFGRLHLLEGEVSVEGRVLATAGFTLGMGRI
ncbi:Beta-hydroxyacyl-(acyl-carrier-protein) dehydratase FabA/FabZ [Geobacter metallireducens RCH3]|uniref:3-hydroxyacyl-ACP dehydratase FabZ family protein n=1 Tax=Geobacter metallireducens TaxID=28232 RepID=UPI00005D5FCE|nr:hotdog domain-containing protein [Geobacter metallireducens]EHP84970.1 Beta-hydroxyacyl-(acyl-carrier-protein) dehydratase FabA/FabZ [Geobacter metallireducens RCH3]